MKKWWDRLNTIPAILFAIFIFSVTFSVLYNWEQVAPLANQAAATNQLQIAPQAPPTSQSASNGAVLSSDLPKLPWVLCRFSLGCMALVDIACLIGAALVWWRCRIASKELEVHYKGAIEKVAESVEPPEPPAPPPAQPIPQPIAAAPETPVN